MEPVAVNRIEGELANSNRTSSLWAHAGWLDTCQHFLHSFIFGQQQTDNKTERESESEGWEAK